MTVYQGDFGKGVATGSGVWSDPGANPCILYGPQVAAGLSSNGAPLPNPGGHGAIGWAPATWARSSSTPSSHSRA